MKYRTIIIFLGIIITLFSCTISKAVLEDNIMESFQTKINTDAAFKDFNIKVQKVGLIKIEPNFYEGIVTVLMDDVKYNIPITVKTDSSTYTWETKEGAFKFLEQKRLERLRH